MAGLMKFPQLSLADDYPPCNSVKDCYPDYCPIISIPLCIKHHCVCIRKADLQVTAATPVNRNIDGNIDPSAP
ncbi:hypothetical protein Hanom_Chr03g00249661 [Helianthus anomalus]